MDKKDIVILCSSLLVILALTVALFFLLKPKTGEAPFEKSSIVEQAIINQQKSR